MPFNIPYDLQKAVADNNLIIFIGSGISMKEGLPSWKTLVLKVLKERGECIEKSEAYTSALMADILTPLEVLDKIENSKKYIFEVFESAVNSVGRSSYFIEKLSRLTKRFITTNFDSIIENTIPNLRKITNGSQYNLTMLDSEDSYILKIHGDVGEIDNCIIFSNQYRTLYSDSNLATFQLKKLFSQHNVLFLGFSFKDHFVKELFDYISRMLDGLGPSHYIITTEPQRHKHLKDICIEDHSDLDNYIDKLLANTAEVREPKGSLGHDNINAKVLKTDGSDIPPSIKSWVGREKESAALNNNFKVYFITGLGGQGKSALAAHHLESMRDSGAFQLFDWRDFKEEDHKFQSKIISMIMLAKGEHNDPQKYTGLEDDTLIDMFFEALGSKRGIFVLDNVDSYIDLEEFEPLGSIGLLFREAVSRNHNCKFIFTCRPFVRYASVDFFQLALSGLEADNVVTYFHKSDLNISPNKISEYALRAHELTKGHPLWISLIVAQAKRGERELEKFLDSISKNDIADDDPSLIMSESILGKIWSSLSDKHMLLLRSLAESVQAITIDDFSDIVSGELTHNRFVRSFRAVKNLGLIIEKAGGEYVELHPIVKEFIRKRYPTKERTKFIYLFIKYYDKVVLVLKPRLGRKLVFEDFLNWTNKIELHTNAKEYQEALDSLLEIHDAIKSAGYIEEYLRVSTILFNRLPWSRRNFSELNNFDRVYLNTIKTAIEYGSTKLIDYLLSKYESIVENKDPAYIKICEAKAYQAWFKGQHDIAIEICEKTAFLLRSANQPESNFLQHYHALALRDTGEPDNMNKALDIFAYGEELPKVIDNSTLDRERGGAFYGNIGRCFQFMGNLDEAINCLSKSLLLIYEGDNCDRLINLGYAGLWLSEVLSKYGKIEAACYFYRFAIISWECASPPLYNKYVREEMFDLANPTVQSIVSTENWRIESYCSDWVRKRVNA